MENKFEEKKFTFAEIDDMIFDAREFFINLYHEGDCTHEQLYAIKVAYQYILDTMKKEN